MMQTIWIQQMVEARFFDALHTNGIAKALAECIEANHTPFYMPQVVDARIGAAKDSPIIRKWWTTPSVCVTGKSKGGHKVVVYAHVPNYFSDPANIKTARKAGLRNGAGIMPELEFYALLDREDNRTVFVVDYATLRATPASVVNAVSKAHKHPQTIPFLGGKERAEQYLATHAEVYGSRIVIWHSDDLDENPRGRLLFLGDDGDSLGLICSNSLDHRGRFLGMGATERRENGLVREAHARNGTAPDLEAVLGKLDHLLAPAIRDRAREELAPLYRKQ
ncbi:MAG: hypothetical protein HZB67_04555 [Candidatus Aenigmarchaeota archaeon]|nr:hypothetical protein [Candidatus Aenigmarchaeota archaeon]